MIRLDGITKKYAGGRLAEGISLTVKTGVCTAITGASGSGKTTLLRIIAGLEKPDSGTVSGIEDMKKSFVFQENRLIEGITAIDNILCVAPDRKKAEEILTVCGLYEHKDKKAGKLSGGMKRRLAIARAVAYGGDIFFLDEPLRELDKETEAGMTAFLKKELAGKTVLLVTHSSEQSDILADEIIRL